MIKSARGNEMRQTYVISICGATDYGFAYYITKLLAKLGRTVIAIDNSDFHDLYLTMAKGNTDNAAESSGVVCVKDTAWSPEPFAHVDFVVVWHGMDVDEELWNYADLRIVTTDYNRFHINVLRKNLRGKRTDVHTVFYNKVTGKVSESSILEKLELGNNDVYTEIGSQVVELDVADAACYQNLTRNGLQALKHFTAQYREVVSDAVNYFIQDPKQIKACIARVE